MLNCVERSNNLEMPCVQYNAVVSFGLQKGMYHIVNKVK